MSKSLIKSNLAERSSTRALLAVSLCASMAAFGCTTNRTLGNGNPVVTPGSRTSPTSGTSAGSESEAVPAMSSSIRPLFPTVRFPFGRSRAHVAMRLQRHMARTAARRSGPVAPGTLPTQRSDGPRAAEADLPQRSLHHSIGTERCTSERRRRRCTSASSSARAVQPPRRSSPARP